MTSPARLQNGQTQMKEVKRESLGEYRTESRGRSAGGHHGSHHVIAEFLYQLTKMLTDDNDEIIEWSQARIKVHHPDRLESEVLHKYFRHSKFASFQRQLNYFGFRKIAGKGKMSPCSYVNDAATEDIRSLLLIKRKTNGSAARKAMGAGRSGAGPRNITGRTIPDVKITMPEAPSQSHADVSFNRELNHSLAAASARRSEVRNASVPYHGGSLRSGLSQQQLQSKALSESLFFPSENALVALAAGQTRPPSIGNLARLTVPQYSGQYNGIPAIRDQAATAAAMNLASSMARPATAAMNAALAASQNANLFESTQVNSLVNEHAASAPAVRSSALNADASGRRVPSQNVLNRLPSSNTIFPDSLSSASLSHMLAPNRVSSLLSLGSFLSRDPSLVDLLGQPGVPQYPPVQPGLGMEPTPYQDANHPARPGNGSK